MIIFNNKYVIPGKTLEILSWIFTRTSIAKNIIIDKPNDEITRIKLYLTPTTSPVAPRIWSIEMCFLYLLNPHLLNSSIILLEYSEFTPYIKNEKLLKSIIISIMSKSINYIKP